MYWVLKAPWTKATPIKSKQKKKTDLAPDEMFFFWSLYAWQERSQDSGMILIFLWCRPFTQEKSFPWSLSKYCWSFPNADFSNPNSRSQVSNLSNNYWNIKRLKSTTIFQNTQKKKKSFNAIEACLIHVCFAELTNYMKWRTALWGQDFGYHSTYEWKNVFSRNKISRHFQLIHERPLDIGDVVDVDVGALSRKSSIWISEPPQKCDLCVRYFDAFFPFFLKSSPG